MVPFRLKKPAGIARLAPNRASAAGWSEAGVWYASAARARNARERLGVQVPSAPRRDGMLRRGVYGAAGSIAACLLLVPVVVVQPDAVYDAPPIVGPAVGFMLGVAFADRKRGLPHYSILVRTGAALAAYLAVGVMLAIAYAAGGGTSAAWISAGLGLPREEWLPPLVLALMAPIPASCVSEIVSVRGFRWLGWVVEAAACIFGLVAAVLLARQALMIFCWVTLGPLSPGAAIAQELSSSLESLGEASPQGLGILGLSTVLGACFVALRVGRRLGARTPVLIVECAVALELLGSCYRLTALAGVVGLVVFELVSRSNRRAPLVRWIAAPIIVVLSLAPVDVSLQALPTRPHLAQTIQGLLTKSTTEVAQEGRVVVVGGCSSFYFAPRWVWVW